MHLQALGVCNQMSLEMSFVLKIQHVLQCTRGTWLSMIGNVHGSSGSDAPHEECLQQFQPTCNVTTLPPIKDMSSDCIVRWCIHWFCSFSYSFISRVQICNLTNICAVAINNPQISLKICPYLIPTAQISFRSQIWMLEATELVSLHSICIHHVMIRSEIKNLTAAKPVGTVQLEPRSASTLAQKPLFLVWSR